MSQVIADVVSANMQAMSPLLPEFFEAGATAYNLMSKSAKKFKISVTPGGSDFRAPMKTQPPATFGAFSLANGSLGTGNSFKLNQFIQTYFALKMPVTVDYSAIVATSGGKSLSAVNAWRESMKDALPSMQSMCDRSFHNIGGNTGKIGTATGLSTRTYTMETSFAANLLQIGMPVEIVTAGGTWTTGTTVSLSPDSLPVVTAIDKGAGTVTVSSTTADGSLAATDSLYFQGAVAAGPTYSWLDGLYSWHSASTSGNIGGLARTTNEVATNLVNAAGSLVPAHIWQGKSKIRQRRGNAALSKKFTGLIHDAQAAAIRNLGIAVMEMQVQNGSAFKTPDLAAGVGDTITFGDVNHLIDVHQDKTRIDWIRGDDNWCRVYGQELDFLKSPEGKMVFEGRNSSGSVTASFSFFLHVVENFLCADPGSELMIYGLSIPSGM